VPDELGGLQPILQRVGSPDPADRPDAAELGRALLAAAQAMGRPAPLPLPGIDLGASEDVHAFPEAGFENDDLTVFGRSDPTGVLPHVTPAPAPGRRWPWLVLVALVAAAVGIAGVAIWKQLQVPSAAVPGVVTMSVADARARIVAADRRVPDVAWQIKEQHRFDDEVAAGIVIAQRPESGKGLDDGATFTLIVSDGAHPVDLPAMNDASEQAARDAIAAAGFTVGKVETRADEVVAPGTVITWSAGGKDRPAQAPKGSPVDLVVSSGPAPRPIPDVTGMAEADARTRLEGLGLVVGRTEGFSDTIEAGKVISTNPPKGDTAPRGGNVSMVVSKGPDLVAVPDVSGMSAEQAASRLEAAGLTVDRVEGPFRGRVYTTDPPAGTRVRRSSSVDLYLKR
jgi:serine/threonine-protein kinase